MIASTASPLKPALRPAGQKRQLTKTCAVQSPPEVSTSTKSNQSTFINEDKPDWTGDSMLSRVVNSAINFPPLFAVMKLGARSAIKGTAEKRGVDWSGIVSDLEKSEVYQIRDEIEDKSLQYPSYYTQPFHGYDDGNLNWKAAFEVEPATAAMALRVWKQEEDLTPEEAQNRLRGGIYKEMREFMNQYNISDPTAALDIGCSTGISTRFIADTFPNTYVTGLDLSPHFLAVAELRERQLGGGGGRRQRVQYLHANMEASSLPDGSFDLITVQFVIHECPAQVIANLVAEAKRLLRPGGMVTFVDNNPRSKVIQSLPPVLFTLMKSTEPWSDEYYAYDLEACMVDAGFKGVVTKESDPRHRTVMGYL